VRRPSSCVASPSVGRERAMHARFIARINAGLEPLGLPHRAGLLCGQSCETGEAAKTHATGSPVRRCLTAWTSA
jgi:hypothetical protein